MAFIYPGGDEQVTPNLGLATWGMDEVLAENMILLDAAIGSESVRINGTIIPSVNFVNSATVTFSVVGSNVSATAVTGGTGTVTSFSSGNLSPLFTTSVATPTTTPALSFALSTQIANTVFAGPVSGVAAAPTFRALVVADFPTVNGNVGSFTYASITVNAQGLITAAASGAAPTGTVTSFSAGNIGTIITSSVATPTTTPALTFAITTQNANTVWAGPTTGAAATPTFRALVAADLPAGTGTVTSFSAGALSPLFTTSVATATTTPALTFALSNAAQNSVFAGPATGGTGAPTYRALVAADLPAGTRAWASLTGDMTETQVAPWDGPTVGTPDTGISRIGVASLAIGNGTTGNTSGSLTAAIGIFNNGGNAVQLTGANSSMTFKSNSANPQGLIEFLSSTLTVLLGIGANQYTTLDFEIFSGGLTGGAGDIAVFNHTTGSMKLPSPAVYGWSSTAAAQGTVDTGISRISAGVIGVGNGTAGSIVGNLSYNRVNTAGADYAGQATVTAGNTTKAVAFAVNYTGTGQPVIVLTPTSDPLALGVPVGYWVTYTGSAGAWTGFTVNIQTALAGNVTFNYCVIGQA